MNREQGEMQMDKEYELAFIAVAVKDNIGYASDSDKNGLFEVDMETGKCVFLDIFEDQPINKKRLHSCAKWIGNKIYFIPDSANKIAIYNLTNKCQESIDIPKPRVQYEFYKRNFNFIDAVEYGDYLWLLPCTYPAVLKINIRTHELEIIDSWVNDKEYYFRTKHCMWDSQAIIANGIDNEVLVVDLEAQSVRIINIGLKNNGVMSIRKIDNVCWFAPRNFGAIISWDVIADEIEEYEDFPDGFEMGKIGFSNVYRYENNIIFSPASANRGVIFSKGKLVEEKDIRWKQEASNMVQYLFETLTHYYYREVFTENRNKFFRISKKDNRRSEFKFYYKITDEKKAMIIDKLLLEKNILKESQVISMQDFIKRIKSSD